MSKRDYDGGVGLTQYNNSTTLEVLKYVKPYVDPKTDIEPQWEKSFDVGTFVFAKDVPAKEGYDVNVSELQSVQTLNYLAHLRALEENFTPLDLYREWAAAGILKSSLAGNYRSMIDNLKTVLIHPLATDSQILNCWGHQAVKGTFLWLLVRWVRVYPNTKYVLNNAGDMVMKPGTKDRSSMLVPAVVPHVTHTNGFVTPQDLLYDVPDEQGTGIVNAHRSMLAYPIRVGLCIKNDLAEEIDAYGKEDVEELARDVTVVNAEYGKVSVNVHVKTATVFLTEDLPLVV